MCLLNWNFLGHFLAAYFTFFLFWNTLSDEYTVDGWYVTLYLVPTYCPRHCALGSKICSYVIGNIFSTHIWKTKLNLFKLKLIFVICSVCNWLTFNQNVIIKSPPTITIRNNEPTGFIIFIMPGLCVTLIHFNNFTVLIVRFQS